MLQVSTFHPFLTTITNNKLLQNTKIINILVESDGYSELVSVQQKGQQYH